MAAVGLMKKFIKTNELHWPDKLDIIIRGVKPKTYREFKARAAKLGIKLRDALQQAMASWVAQSSTATSVAGDLNNQAYEKMKSNLLKNYYGKHIAIAGGELVAVANSLEQLGTRLRKLNVGKALGLHVGYEEIGETGEWLWGSIALENVRTTTRT